MARCFTRNSKQNFVFQAVVIAIVQPTRIETMQNWIRGRHLICRGLLAACVGIIPGLLTAQTWTVKTLPSARLFMVGHGASQPTHVSISAPTLNQEFIGYDRAVYHHASPFHWASRSHVNPGAGYYVQAGLFGVVAE